MGKTAVASLNAKLPKDEKDAFVENARALGLSPSSALRVLVSAFNAYQGFPFEVRRTIPMGPAERASVEELDAQIAAGTARRYASFADFAVEIDAEIAGEEQA